MCFLVVQKTKNSTFKCVQIMGAVACYRDLSDFHVIVCCKYECMTNFANDPGCRKGNPNNGGCYRAQEFLKKVKENPITLKVT